jgi:hypothetical protein
MTTRKIIDPKQNGEKVWLKGHAKAIYMSDGSTVEDAINNIDIPSINDFVKTEDLPNFDEFAKTKDIPSLDEYASKEWVNNKNYATEYDLKTIDYSSINNVPITDDNSGELNIADENGNICMKASSEAVYGKDFIGGEHKLSEKANKDYVDNSIAELVDGAPETLNTLNELSAALKDNADIVDVLNQSISAKQDIIPDIETIRQGAAKGATALQSYTEKYKGTVTGVKVNGSTKSPSNGVVDLGTVITSHQDISGKQDKLVSGTNIKTINGTSILGSGDIEVSEGSSSGAYAEVNHGTDDTVFTLTPNTFHLWDEVLSLVLTLGEETNGVANEYLFQFTSGATATTLTLPDDIKWTEDLIIEPNMIYQMSILKGLASVLSWDNAPNLIENHITYDEGSFMNGATIIFEYPTASELIFTMVNYSTLELVIPQGTTQMVIDWFEPLPPMIANINPTEDSIYKYIL